MDSVGSINKEGLEVAVKGFGLEYPLGWVEGEVDEDEETETAESGLWICGRIPTMALGETAIMQSTEGLILMMRQPVRLGCHIRAIRNHENRDNNNNSQNCVFPRF